MFQSLTGWRFRGGVHPCFGSSLKAYIRRRAEAERRGSPGAFYLLRASGWCEEPAGD